MEELLWVRIETTKSNDDIWSIKGQILKAIFDGMVSNQLTTGYFKLSKVYWIAATYDEEGNELEEKLYQYGQDKLEAYHGDLYLKIEHLVSIAPIDAERELTRFKKNEDKHLSLVSPIRP